MKIHRKVNKQLAMPTSSQLLQSNSESRPLETFSPRKRNTLMETAQEILRERLQTTHAIKYNINRISPGGPDPKHQ
ncbi:hypothetical protein RND71_004629 [Anisodus tanguticus]|uniref:Uncharacterized protein n=1 Tax=Anisodus tanguticus TaxID=243964 RepID=A0AAE1SRB0_9SOLA|nr:hypothetical protein RND71_004629 [Anisodus tanguticus]